MNLVKKTMFDRNFFLDFNSISNRIYRHHPYKLQESFKELENKFSETALFNKHHEWCAFIVYDHAVPCGRAAVSCPKENWKAGKFLPLGFFECENQLATAKLLFDAAALWAKEKGYSELRGPINGHFFASYRIQRPYKDHIPFSGEPVFPDYYHELFKGAGFKEAGEWKTLKVDFKTQAEKSTAITERLSKKKNFTDIKMKPVDKSNWKGSLEIFYKMFMNSYRNMPEFMPITFEEFAEEFDSFKYVVQGDFSLYLEYQGKPIGFLISYFDPLPILLQAQNSVWPWKKLVALYRLKRNRNRYLIPYVGKTGEAKDVIGVAALLSTQSFKAYNPEKQPYYYACFLKSDSKALASVPKEAAVEVAAYIIYSLTSPKVV